MHILITGASGMLAGRIAQQLTSSNHTVSALGRSPVKHPSFNAFYKWDPQRGTMDAEAFEGVDAVIHLAGASIADKKWTPQRKAEILESRVQSTSFLADQLDTIPNRIHTVVAASAVGYYGDTGVRLVNEADAPGKGFLAQTCVAWEGALQSLGNEKRRLVILRIGFVIDRTGGALPVMARPVQWFAGAPYGSGRQYISWIDSTDLSRLFERAITRPEMKGVYNAVAPVAVTNRDFIKAVAKTLKRPVWPIAIPAFVLRGVLGEQSVLILEGQRVSSEKNLAEGFQFEFPTLSSSLEHHLN